MKRRAVVGPLSGLLTALVVAGANAQATAEATTEAADWRRHCAGVEPARPVGRRVASQEALRYNDPMQALARACARLAQGDASFAARLDLADSLVAASRPEAAASLLDQLGPSVAGQPLAAVALELSRANLALDAGQYARAEGPVERALTLLQLQATVPADLRARALVMRATTLRALNKAQGLALAAAALDEAEQLVVQDGRRESYRMSDIYNQRTMLANARENLDETLRWAAAERDLIRRLSGPDAPAQLDALATLASVTSQQRKFAVTVRHLEEGRRIGRKAPAASRRAYLGILNSLSPMLVDQGRPQQAFEVASDAVNLAEAGWGAGSQNTLTPLERRAGAEISLQRYADARKSFDEIQAILRREGPQIPLVRRLRIIDSTASFLARVSDFDAAQRLIEEGLALVPEGTALLYWRGRFLQRAGLQAAWQQQWAQAAALHEQARPLMVPTLGHSHPYLTVSNVYRCEAQLRARLDASACAAVAEGVDGVRQGAPSERVMARRVLALQATLAGQNEPAFEHLLQGLAAAQSVQHNGPIWRPLGELAVHLRAQGQRPLAVLLAKQAVSAIEAVRHLFLDAAQLNAVAQDDRQAVYRRLADWLAEDGRVDEALEVFGLLKAHEFGGFAAARSNSSAAGRKAPQLTPAERRWLAASPLASSPVPAAAAPSKLAAADNADSADAAVSMDAIQAQERQRVQAWRQALRMPLLAEAATASQAATGLPANVINELTATFFIGPQHLNLVLRSRLGQRLHRMQIDPQALSRDIGRLLEGLAQREDVMPLLQALHGRVAAPLVAEARRAGASRLVLRLDGDLRYLPFAALHDGRGYLVENFTVLQQAVGGAAVTTTAARPTAAWVNAFGSTRATPGLPALPGVLAEICGIVGGTVEAGPGPRSANSRRPCAAFERVGSLPGRGWLDDAYTQTALRQAAASGLPGRLDVLHIGTHFVLRPGEVGGSWMQLGDGQRLPLGELLTWTLKSQDLVTLSACQTGLGGGDAASGGGEVEGLATLLLQRGAHAVIGSLWPVEDRSTSELMRHLYSRIRAGAEPATALRQAQLQVLEGGSGQPAARLHPFHWAGFYLTTAGR